MDDCYKPKSNLVPTAAESAERTEDGLQRSSISALAYIVEGITNMVEKGEFTCSLAWNGQWSAQIRDYITKTLRESGYTVNYISDQRDGDYLNISWRKK